jgi:hypothetical protein
MNKRSKVLLISGVVAAVVIGAAFFYFPPVEESDAQGAIGVVQKHQDQQIKASDVVLGDEQERKQEAALYGSLLTDAMRLESLSAELASFAESLGSGDFQDLASFSETLGSYSDLAASESLGILSDLQSHAELQSFSADLASIQRGLENRTALGMREIASFQQMISNMAKSLESESALANFSILFDQAKLEGISRQLENRELSLSNAELMQMSRELGSFVSDLQMRESLESNALEALTLQSKIQQLESKLLQQRVLVQSRAQLGSLSDNLQSRTELMSFSADLANRAMALESRALSNMQQRFEMRTLAAKSLASMAMLADSARDSLQGRANLDASGLQSLTASLGSLTADLQNHQPLLAQRFVLGMHSELAAISNHLEGRERLGSRHFVGMKQLESNAIQNLGSFNQYLGSLTESLSSRAFVANTDLDMMGSRALDLQNRTLTLQSSLRQ